MNSWTIVAVIFGGMFAEIALGVWVLRHIFEKWGPYFAEEYLSELPIIGQLGYLEAVIHEAIEERCAVGGRNQHIVVEKDEDGDSWPVLHDDGQELSRFGNILCAEIDMAIFLVAMFFLPPAYAYNWVKIRTWAKRDD